MNIFTTLFTFHVDYMATENAIQLSVEQPVILDQHEAEAVKFQLFGSLSQADRYREIETITSEWLSFLVPVDMFFESYKKLQHNLFLRIQWSEHSASILTALEAATPFWETGKWDVNWHVLQTRKQLSWHEPSLSHVANELLHSAIQCSINYYERLYLSFEEMIPILHASETEETIEKKVHDTQSRLLSSLPGMWKSTLKTERLAHVAIATSEMVPNEQLWKQQMGITASGDLLEIGLRLQEPEAEGDFWDLDILLRLTDDKRSDEWFWNPDKRLPVRLRNYENIIEDTMNQWMNFAPYLRNEKTKRMNSLLSETEAWRFLSETAELFVNYRIPILLPHWWSELKRQKVRLKAVTKGETPSNNGFFHLDTLVQFDWRLSIGATSVDEKQFQSWIQNNRRLIRMNGEWMVLDPNTVKKLQKIMSDAEKKGISMRDCITSYLNKQADEELLIENVAIEEDEDEVALEVQADNHFSSWMDQWRIAQDVDILP
ncbi:MAG: SNF2 helicase-associated domain-containing protein, partial [Bacilli bacterium]